MGDAPIILLSQKTRGMLDDNPWDFQCMVHQSSPTNHVAGKGVQWGV